MLVFIPAAGRGSRIGSGCLPKPLQSIGAEPLIGRVMNLYPPGTRFVLALGFGKEKIRPIVNLIADTGNFQVDFIETSSFEPGSLGLTQTLIDSRHALQEPFVFHAVDTLFDCLPTLATADSQNIVHFARPSTPAEFRSIVGQKWVRTSPSSESVENVYVGLAHINNPAEFWSAFDASVKEAEAGEILGLPGGRVQIHHLERSVWLDCGSIDGLENARRFFQSDDVVLPRENEAIWNIGERMVKFHCDPEFVTERVQRGQWLKPYVPDSEIISPNAYVYERAPGKTISRCNESVFIEFLKWCDGFWHGSATLVEKASDKPRKSDYVEFYQKKTFSRFGDFLLKYPDTLNIDTINGSAVAKLDSLLESVDWDALSEISVARVHGDLHPENVVFDSETRQFKMLDWRQNVAGSVGPLGDLYYDLAKINHGLIVDHGVIEAGLFGVAKSGTEITFWHKLPAKKARWSKEFRKFLKVEGYDLRRVETLTALIFINIAPLHHSPYDQFLGALGHSMLNECLA